MQRLFYAITFLLIGGSAFAQAVNADRDFVLKAAEGGMAEVAAGKLAQEKGQSPEVRNFGAMMVKDHTAANEKLKSVAAKKQIALPDGLNAEHKAMKKELEAKQGSDFDAAYLKGQVKDHTDTEALFRSEIKSGKDAEVKAFAKDTLPTVTVHLTKVKELAAAGSSTAGSKPAPSSDAQTGSR